MRFLRAQLERLVSMPMEHRDMQRKHDRNGVGLVEQPWMMFGTDGKAINSVPDLAKGFDGSRVLLLFLGGRFIYPGIQINHERKVFAHDKMITLKTLSLQPLVYAVDAFLEKEECKHIIERSAPNMKKISESRTFSTYLLSAKDDLKLLNIDERVANLTRTPLHYHEQVQVQQYNHGQQYESQLDYKKWKNRLATVFWYLSDVNLGGEMNFPSAVGFEPIDDENVASECSTGLRVKPREGKVILFYSLLPDGTGDKTSLHGECPVGHGQKWAANKWIWNKQLRMPPGEHHPR